GPADRAADHRTLRQEPGGAAGRGVGAGDPLPDRPGIPSTAARARVGEGPGADQLGEGRRVVGCGLIPHLELARRPDLYGTPVIVGRWEEHGIAASEEATAVGVVPGQPLRQAEHLCPHATFLMPDHEATVRLRELIASAMYD